MKEYLKQNLTLVLAFSLPVILILVVALSTYLPSLFLSTNHNFIYAYCDDRTNYYYECNDYLQKRYTVTNDKLLINDIDTTVDRDGDGLPDGDKAFSSRIFIHDTEKNESREITSEEAQTLSLSSLLTSPDGVTVSSDYNRGANFFFIFDGGASYGYYLMKGGSQKKLNLINSNDRYYYADNFHFIGWVTPGRN
jgi:hypothetical protein